MSASAADYAWIAEPHPWPTVAYCLTFVRRLAPVEVLDRLGAHDRVQVHGTRAIGESSYAAWENDRLGESFVAATQADGWSVIVEENGFIGVTSELMTPVSMGTATVGHFRNVNAVDQFLWIEDGHLILQFEPLFPHQRFGMRADDQEVVAEMEGVGFDLSDGDEPPFEHHTEAAFALAERITGVGVTLEFVERAQYVGGFVRNA